MGGGGSKTVISSTSSFGSTTEKQSDLLLWKRCIFMTNKQYINNYHIDENMYYKKDMVTDVDKYIKEQIIDIASKLPNKKVPAPIYVMYAKKLEYNGTIFGNCMDEAQSYSVLKNEQDKLLIESIGIIFKILTASMNLAMAKYKKSSSEIISNYQNEYNALNNRKNEIQNNINNIKQQLKNFKCINDENYKQYKDISEGIFIDKEELYKSELANFTFNKNKKYEVIIYIPNLNKNCRYFTNFKDYTIHNEWMYSFIKFDLLLFTIIQDSDSTYKRLKALYKTPSIQSNPPFLKFLEQIMRIYIIKREMEYPLIKELTTACFEKGCVSDYGEDFDTIVPSFTRDSGQKKINANNKAPYYPSKCLKRLNYKENMFDDNDDGSDIPKGFKKKTVDYLLGDCLKDKEKEPLMLDQLKKCAVKFRHKEIADFNWDEGTDKFSVEYNRKILSELSQKKYTYPGIQEVIFPLFILNENHADVNQYITYMPWGNKLLTNEYALTIDGDYKIFENKPFKSLNDVYKLVLTSTISIYKNNKLYYRLTDQGFNNYFNKYLVFENNGYLNLYGTNINGEKVLWSMLVTDVSKAIQPVSLGFNPNDGRLVVFDNGLNIVNSKLLDETIGNSIKLYSSSEIQSDSYNALNTFSDLFDKTLNDIRMIEYNLIKSFNDKNKSIIDYISSLFHSPPKITSEQQKNDRKSLGITPSTISETDTTTHDVTNTGIIWDDEKEVQKIITKLKNLEVLF